MVWLPNTYNGQPQIYTNKYKESQIALETQRLNAKVLRKRSGNGQMSGIRILNIRIQDNRQTSGMSCDSCDNLSN